MTVLLALLVAGLADAASTPKSVVPRKAGSASAQAPRPLALPAVGTQARAASASFGVSAGVDVLKETAARGDASALSETTAWMLDGSRPRPFETAVVPEPAGWRAIGPAVKRWIGLGPAPRIAAFTRAQDNPRHPIPETSLLFTRERAGGSPYAYDKEIAAELGLSGFSSFMRLDDDYIEMRLDSVEEAAAMARRLAAIGRVKRVFVSPRALSLALPAP